MILQEYEALMRQVCVITCGIIIVYTSRYVVMCCSAVLYTIRSVQGKVANTYEAGKLNLTRYVEVILLVELDPYRHLAMQEVMGKAFLFAPQIT